MIGLRSLYAGDCILKYIGVCFGRMEGSGVLFALSGG